MIPLIGFRHDYERFLLQLRQIQGGGRCDGLRWIFDRRQLDEWANRAEVAFLAKIGGFGGLVIGPVADEAQRMCRRGELTEIDAGEILYRAHVKRAENKERFLLAVFNPVAIRFQAASNGVNDDSRER